MDALVEFSNNFKRLRDAKPTPEEQLAADMRTFQILKAKNLPISLQLQNVNDNFDSLLKKVIVKKGGDTAGRAASQSTISIDSDGGSRF